MVLNTSYYELYRKDVYVIDGKGFSSKKYDQKIIDRLGYDPQVVGRGDLRVCRATVIDREDSEDLVVEEKSDQVFVETFTEKKSDSYDMISKFIDKYRRK